ncbi:MAG: peptidylprolyl isomerase [Bdellovibrionales bacterium]|nr:peptidylprolyl isomerase [Bdellovibrionales bacterium]
MIAVIKTNMGTIKAKLFNEESPNTVANFAGLAEGTKEFLNTKTGQMETGHYYDGTTFHRVIQGFMIQGGCPLGNGTGGPGYEFDNEDHPSLSHDKPGILSMANRGRDTNGSQFFITTVSCPHLNGGYSVFGEVVEGMEVVHSIEESETDFQDRPVTPVVIESVRIEK